MYAYYVNIICFYVSFRFKIPNMLFYRESIIRVLYTHAKKKRKEEVFQGRIDKKIIVIMDEGIKTHFYLVPIFKKIIKKNLKIIFQ